MAKLKKYCKYFQGNKVAKLKEYCEYFQGNKIPKLRNIVSHIYFISIIGPSQALKQFGTKSHSFIHGKIKEIL